MLGIKQKTVYVLDESFIVVGNAYALQFTDYDTNVVSGLCVNVKESWATFIVATGPLVRRGETCRRIDVTADEIAKGVVNILGGYSYSPNTSDGDDKEHEKKYEIPKSLIPPFPGGGVALCSLNPSPIVINDNPIPLVTNNPEERPPEIVCQK